MLNFQCDIKLNENFTPHSHSQMLSVTRFFRLTLFKCDYYQFSVAIEYIIVSEN